jgi:ankyrin repeat protein
MPQLYPHLKGISCVDASGALPLHWATHNEGLKSDRMIDYLISLQPAAVTKMDDDGYTPLHWAVNNLDPQPPVVRKLLDEYPEAVS